MTATCWEKNPQIQYIDDIRKWNFWEITSVGRGYEGMSSMTSLAAYEKREGTTWANSCPLSHHMAVLWHVAMNQMPVLFYSLGLSLFLEMIRYEVFSNSSNMHTYTHIIGTSTQTLKMFVILHNSFPFYYEIIVYHMDTSCSCSFFFTFKLAYKVLDLFIHSAGGVHSGCCFYFLGLLNTIVINIWE